MFSLNGNAIVVLVSLEIYHRIGSLQTRHHIRERERKERERERHARVTFLFLTYIEYLPIQSDGH